MKNLLNCHSIGLHSFPISLSEDGFYRRIFYAAPNHNLWKPVEIAIHPHHVDIKITILDGVLYNPIYRENESGEMFGMFKWNSHILNGNGGFIKEGEKALSIKSSIRYTAGKSVLMKACELHTVQVPKGDKCVWLIEEYKPSCEYFPINYSHDDLEKWTPNGLYIEVDDSVKNMYVGNYLESLK